MEKLLWAIAIVLFVVGYIGLQYYTMGGGGKRANGEVCSIDLVSAGCTGNNCVTWMGVSYAGDHSQCKSNHCKCKDDVCMCSEK